MTPIAGEEGKLIYLVAGEPSGDVLGGRLMAGIKAKSASPVRFAGVGGAKMTAEGMASSFPMSELSLMGIAEILPHLPRLARRLSETAAEVTRLRPDAVVTIDSPGFNLRLAKRLKGLGIPLIHYVAPTVWAWHASRAAKAARLFDHLLALFPFEAPLFERHGLATSFVGHPVLEGGAANGNGPRFRQQNAIPGDAPVLCVLPGSRRGETSRLMPVFAATVTRLNKTHPDIRVVLPLAEAVAADLADQAAAWPGAPIIVRGEEEKFDAFAAADLALAASGTVSLELAMAGVPAVIAYKMSPLTATLAKLLVRLSHVSLPNILLGREIMEEFLQGRCRPDLLAAALGLLLDNPGTRSEKTVAAAEAISMLSIDGAVPSAQAAEVVLDVLGQHAKL